MANVIVEFPGEHVRLYGFAGPILFLVYYIYLLQFKTPMICQWYLASCS